MRDVFRSLFNLSVGDIRTHHVFVDETKFLNACYEVPIKSYLEDFSLVFRETKKGSVYWYETPQGDKTPETPVKVLAKALFFLQKGDWEMRHINPVVKPTFWKEIDKNVLSASDYRLAAEEVRENSAYHLLDLIAQVNLQVRVFDDFKKQHEFDQDGTLMLKLLHTWYRTLQKQAVSHLSNHQLDIKDASTVARINGIARRYSSK